MHWNDRGIILSIHKFDEQGAVVRVLTEHHGLHAGVDKYALSSRKRGMYQPGNLVEVEWKARLPEHLGTFRTELVEPLAAFVLDDIVKLSALQSGCNLLEQLLVERDPHTDVYDEFLGFLRVIRFEPDCPPAYVRFEFNLLRLLGFGLDLSSCAATGTRTDLTYISPRSGRAVSREAGEPWAEKLFRYPQFLRVEAQETAVSHEEILDGMRLCGYFLEHRAFSGKGGNLPRSRERLFQRCMQRLMPEEKPREQIVEYLG